MMATEKYGIKEFKEALVAAARVTKPLLDGFQLTDVFDLAKAMTSIPAAIENADEIPKEASDFSPAEMTEITTLLREELDNVGDAEFQKLVPVVVNFALATARLAAVIAGVK